VEDDSTMSLSTDPNRHRANGNPRTGLISIAVVLLAVSSALAADFRTWTDSTGKFSIKAKFVSLDSDSRKVTLEKEDGKQFEIELNNLCDADQKFIANREKGDESTPPPPAADVFKPKEPTSRPRSRIAFNEVKRLTSDWSRSRVVGLIPGKSDWSIASKSAPSKESLLSTRPVGLPPKSDFFEGMKGLVTNAASRRAVIGYNRDEPRPAGTTRLILCDLERARIVGAGTVSGKYVPLALHDDGTRVLMRQDDWGGKDRLELWSVADGGIDKKAEWIPYDDLKGGDREIKWAAFLDPKRVATISNSGMLVVWELEKARPLFHLKAQGSCVPALSPDRKLLAFTTDKEVGILDVNAGEVVALESTPNTPFPNLAFSPSGQRFACLTMNKVYVWNLSNGEIYRELPLMNGVFANGQITWTSEEHILVGNRFLLDLTNQICVWDYEGAELTGGVSGVCYFAVSQGHENQGALVPARLPHPGVEQTLKTALKDPNFFILKSGASVSLNVDGIADASEKPKVLASLTSKLQRNGVGVAANAPLVLTASTETGKDREISYRTMGRGMRGVQTYRVREYFSRVKFLYQGKPAWESSVGNIPHIAMLQNGETMETHLRKQEHPNYGFFNQVELPKLLTRPTGRPALGSSKVTMLGIR
jgi:hypothetical protein